MKLFAWVFGLLGAVCLGVGLAFLIHTQRFVDRAEVAPGVVIELLHTRDRDGDVLYRPLVGYQTAGGALVEFASTFESHPPAYEVGEKVTVLYDPTHPDEARLRSFFSLWGIAAVFGTLGSVFFLGGAGAGLWVHWQMRRQQRLRACGDLVLTTFDRVERDPLIKINRRFGWRVHTVWIDPLTGQHHAFRSHLLREDPGGRWTGHAIPVYVKRGRPQHYVMDLPAKAAARAFL